MEENNVSKNNNWWKYVIIVVAILAIVAILLISCGVGKKHKIILHYGDETIEVDENFNLSDLEVEGGEISFLVDSDGHLVPPGSKLDPEKEYSAHLIPSGKQTVTVTYKVDDKSTVYKYQKGAGLLFPEDPKKEGYVFVAWKFEDIDDYPIFMMPVEKDMVLVAVFEKSKDENGKCTLNCDTNNDGACDLNCDTNGDGKADTNVDKNGDGKPDLNVDKDHDGICDLNCDTNKDGKPDTNKDTTGDGKPDTNIDTDGDGKCDINCDTNNDGKCDKECHGTDLKIIDDDNGDLIYDCEYYEFYQDLLLIITSHKDNVIYTKVDGKELQPSEYWGSSPVYYVNEYKNSGKTIDCEGLLLLTDSAGQKYYKLIHAKLIFSKDCDKESETEDIKEIALKCSDYEEQGSFIFVSPIKKDQVKYTKIDGSEVKASDSVKTKDGTYPSYNITNYYNSGNSITIEIGYSVSEKGTIKNKTYKAKITFPKDCELGVSDYTLTLDPNGGTVSPKSMGFIEGQIIADLPTPVRTGYQFEGWYTKKVGGDLLTEDSKMPKKNMTVYAHWEKNPTSDPDPVTTYTLTYNANGGSVSPTSKTLNSGDKYGSLPTPSWANHTFNGWFTAASGGTKVTADTTISKDTTIFAQWTEVDNGTISLAASKSCIIGNNNVTVTATVNNALDSTVTWEKDSCLTLSGSGNSRTVTASGCGSTAKVTAKLANGQKSTVTLKYEPKLTYTVYDGSTVITPLPAGYYFEGDYEAGNPSVQTNQAVTFTANTPSNIKSSTSTSVSLKNATTTLTIKTACNQTETLTFHPVIN